ncbi:hypothetical protein LY76DRAFT_596894 [Colletotrichum caudatum]|nr:hypothetical protein LY76DRAFT_596894 [Colletotrichum caudatum]
MASCEGWRRVCGGGGGGGGGRDVCLPCLFVCLRYDPTVSTTLKRSLDSSVLLFYTYGYFSVEPPASPQRLYKQAYVLLLPLICTQHLVVSQGRPPKKQQTPRRRYIHCPPPEDFIAPHCCHRCCRRPRTKSTTFKRHSQADRTLRERGSKILYF